MKNNYIKCSLLVTTGVLSTNLIDAQELKMGDKPNVLFIMSDDLRPNLSPYGDNYAITPNIENLANNGITFLNAYCQQAVSNPSRASLLTGLKPDETGVTNLTTHFREKIPNTVTLPQAFLNNGYVTYSTGKVFHSKENTLDPVSWTIQGEHFSAKREYILEKNRVNDTKQSYSEVLNVDDTVYPDGKIADDAIKFLRMAVQNDKPFFIAVGFKKPHAPYCVPKKYYDMYEGVKFDVKHPERTIGSPDIAYHNNQEIHGYKNIPKGGIPYDIEQDIIRSYYACITYVDAQIGKVLKELKNLGLDKNTIIVFVGDHGYHLGEQSSWCKSTNFELDTRVPFILSVPDLKTKELKRHEVVSLIDIYPTLIDICGITPEIKLSGLSMKNMLENPKAEWDNVAYSQFVRPYAAIGDKVKPEIMGYSIRTQKYRCTYWYDCKTGAIVAKELYKLSDNRIEERNLSGMKNYRKVETELALLLDNYRLGN